jgi:hypothetical protein
MAFDLKQLRWVRLPFGGLIECVVLWEREISRALRLRIHRNTGKLKRM